MGLTVAQVVERAREEIFEAGGVARPAWDVQEGAITDAALTLTLEGRQTFVPPDGDIEWDDDSMEVADVKSVAGTVVTLQNRGALGSAPAAHVDGTRVFLDNPYKKYVLVNGLKALIGQLYGFGIYRKGTDTSSTYNYLTPIDLPAGAKDTFGEILITRGAGLGYSYLKKGANFQVLHAFDPPKVQFYGGGQQGFALTIPYKSDFDTSTFTLATDLDTVGIPSTLQQHLATGLAGHILMGRDVPLLESEHIRPDPQNPQQPGTRLNVGRMLWQSFLSGPVQAERVRLMEINPPVITFERS